MFYLFDQINSGGSFDIDDKVTQFVIIEANSADQANDFAESIGIYFDGIDDGKDCECCGDRWTRVSSGNPTPFLYDKPPEEYTPILIEDGVVYCRIYFLNGTVKEYIVPPENKKRVKKKIERIVNSYRMMLN